ncbi:hypothetical protein Tco_0294238 [Tanacetum coccineum]
MAYYRHEAILKQFQATPPPASVKLRGYLYTCGGCQPYYTCLAAECTYLPRSNKIIFKDKFFSIRVNYNQDEPRSTSGNVDLFQATPLLTRKVKLKAITTLSGSCSMMRLYRTYASLHFINPRGRTVRDFIGLDPGEFPINVPTSLRAKKPKPPFSKKLCGSPKGSSRSSSYPFSVKN